MPARLLMGLALAAVAAQPAAAFLAYVSNEKSNTVSVIDTNKWEVVRTIKVGQPGQMMFFATIGANQPNTINFRSHYNNSTLSKSGSWSATKGVKPPQFATRLDGNCWIITL